MLYLIRLLAHQCSVSLHCQVPVVCHALSCRASPLSKAPVLARRDLALLQLTGDFGLPATQAQGGLHRVYFLVFHCKQRGVGTLSLLFSLSHSLDSPSESQGFFEGLLQAGGFGSPATQAQGSVNISGSAVGIHCNRT